MVDTYKGVRDFYPADKRVQNYILGVMRTTVESFGYEEYDASLLEPTELYTAKTSEEIIRDQTYTFTDRGGRSVTLRPEMTPTVARMVAAKKRELGYPLRWYSIPNCFRYERPQKGRLREFWQLNFDLFGAEGVAADVEIIEVTSSLLKAYGATEDMFEIRIANRGLLETAFDAAGLNPEQKHAYRMLLDKKPKMDPAEFVAQAKAITDKDPLAIMENGDPSVKQARDELDAVLKTVKERGVGNARFDPSIVRGFDYYTGIVFEIYDTSGENTRSLFGGGRYDALVGEYGGEDVPAVGIAVSDVIVEDFLTTHKLLPDLTRTGTLYLAPVTTEDAAAAAEAAAALRKTGLNVAFGMPVRTVQPGGRQRSIGDHIKAATKLGIRLFAAYGEKERASGTIEIKNLATGATKVQPLEPRG
jgi:histidyl-tRNA synthetase